MGWRPAHTELQNQAMWTQNHTMLSWINEKRIENVSCCFKNQLCGFGKRVSTMMKKNGVKIDSMWFRNDMLGSMWSQNLHEWSWNYLGSLSYVDSRFACFYLTRQLESRQQKFRLAGVVLVASKPHVFNLTGQLASKSPEFPTLAATDLWRLFQIKSEIINYLLVGQMKGHYSGPISVVL